MMRVAVARAVSIAGHPVVLLLVAALIAASRRGASLRQLWLISGALVTLGVVVLGFSWLQVRAGRWSHIDASVRNERNSLNVFLGAVCFLSAVLLWFLTRRTHMSLGLALSGALIVIERTIGLRSYIESGVALDAVLSYDLLVTIFNHNLPLHDGAVIVQNNRIAAAACFLPLTVKPRLSKDLGTRHRAAIGITEETDAVAIVVSEETGSLSFASGGQIERGLTLDALRMKLRESFGQKSQARAVSPVERTNEGPSTP